MGSQIIKVLLVGDEKCGKTTFLSFVHPLYILTNNHEHHESNLTLCHSRVSAGENVNPIPLLRDMDQPFIFEIKLSGKEFRLEFYDTSSPVNWRLLDPDLVVICFDISQRLSLINMKRYVRLLSDHSPSEIELWCTKRSASRSG